MAKKSSSSNDASQARSKILSTSSSWLGVKYRWAGSSRSGVDCSGLTMEVYKAVGILLPHNSAAQALLGKKITQGQAQAGDLVFFGNTVISHVGIWLGGGMVRHAPHTGAVVRDESLSSIAGTVKLRGFRNYLGDVGKASTVTSSSNGSGGDVLVPPPSAGGPSGALAAPTATSNTSSSNRRKAASSASNAAHILGVDWNPLHWPGDILGGVTSDVEHAALEAVIYGSLLAVGAGLILIGAAATARKATGGASPIPMPAGGGGGGGAAPMPVPDVPIPA
jgi:hypothetical protein